MSFNSGTFSLYTPGNPVVTNTIIDIDWANNTLNDIATGLTSCLLKDGTQTATALVPFAYGLSAATGTFQYPASTVVGRWTTPAFAAGDYTANDSMTWTVASGDVITNAYTIMDKIMSWSFAIDTTTVGGTPSSQLRIAIPASKVATKSMYCTIYVLDNNTATTGFGVVGASGTVISLGRTDGASWAASTNLTSVRGFIVFEIN